MLGYQCRRKTLVLWKLMHLGDEDEWLSNGMKGIKRGIMGQRGFDHVWRPRSTDSCMLNGHMLNSFWTIACC